MDKGAQRVPQGHSKVQWTSVFTPFPKAVFILSLERTHHMVVLFYLS